MPWRSLHQVRRLISSISRRIYSLIGLYLVTGKDIRFEQITAEQFAEGGPMSVIEVEEISIFLHEAGCE